MPVPNELREALDEKRDMEGNIMKYQVANIEGKLVFLQEAVWALYNKEFIPTGKLVAHKDGNTLNNEPSNLELVDENKKYKDLHLDKNKIFHVENMDQNKEFIKKHFNDIYQVLYEGVSNDTSGPKTEEINNDDKDCH